MTFKKVWNDLNGDVIIYDSFDGLEVSINFVLQVAEVTNASQTLHWKYAEDYFRANLTPEQYADLFGSSYSFGKSVTGEITDPKWSDRTNVFMDLPNTFKKDGSSDYTFLTYRVVETNINYGIGSQTITVNDGGIYDENETGKLVESVVVEAGLKGTTTTIKNTLSSVNLEVKKVWSGDNNNAYGTRPEGTADDTWQTKFVVRASSDGGSTWKDFQYIDKMTGIKKSLIVTLSDLNDVNSKSADIKGLPLTGYEDRKFVNYTYEIKELSASYTSGESQGYIIGDGDAFNSSYIASYKKTDEPGKKVTTVTNTMTSTPPPEGGGGGGGSNTIYAEKIWKPENPTGKSIKFTLQYFGEDGKWKDFVTLTLNGAADSSERTAGKVVYSEYEPWKAKWSDLPNKLEGADNSLGRTMYRVIETNIPSGYIFYSETRGQDADGNYVYTFTNVKETSFKVTKKWYGDSASTSHSPITVNIYRTTIADDAANGTGGSIVTDSDGNNLVVTLSASSWSATTINLPYCDGDGNRFYYYAVENPTVDGYYVYYNTVVPDSSDKTGSTEVVNVNQQSLTGSKKWQDNGNKYLTRPDKNDFEPILQYTTVSTPVETDWVNVPESLYEFNWTDTSADKWTYEYTKLPVTDKNGNTYKYRATEKDLDSYERTDTTDFKLVNKLKEDITISIKKIWKDTDKSNRVDDLGLQLYRHKDGEAADKWDLVDPSTYTVSLWDKTDSDTWICEFSGLPLYDDNENRYTYKIIESNVPEGYDVSYSTDSSRNTLVINNDITNYQRGSLTVDKKVTGNKANYNDQFKFTVNFILPDNVSDGVYGKVKINDIEETITFTDKKGSVEFYLKDGESITISDLPCNTHYQVTEEKSSYKVDATNAEGTIPYGDEAKASFINSKNESDGGGYTPRPKPDPDPDPEEKPIPDPEIVPKPTPDPDINPNYPKTESETSSENSENNNSYAEESVAESHYVYENNYRIVKTGDEFNINKYIGLICCAGAILIITIVSSMLKKRKKM